MEKKEKDGKEKKGWKRKKRLEKKEKDVKKRNGLKKKNSGPKKKRAQDVFPANQRWVKKRRALGVGGLQKEETCAWRTGKDSSLGVGGERGKKEGTCMAYPKATAALS